MKKFITSVIAFLLPVISLAATGSLTFTAPTTRVDGSTLSPTQIAGYEITCSAWTPAGGVRAACPAGMVSPTALSANATSGSLTFNVPASGGRACLTLVTIDSAGVRSAPSSEGCKTFAAVAPNPPTNVTVAVVIGINMAPVLSIASTGGRGATILGFVPVGLACSGAPVFTYRGKTWRRTTGLPVLWWASQPTNSAAVPCS
jgi:hypothetical protein